MTPLFYFYFFLRNCNIIFGYRVSGFFQTAQHLSRYTLIGQACVNIKLVYNFIDQFKGVKKGGKGKSLVRFIVGVAKARQTASRAAVAARMRNM